MNGEGFTGNAQSVNERIYKSTILSLAEMLKILKQGDNKQSRRQLKDHCQELFKAGKEAGLARWAKLLETSSVAISDTNNPYTSTAKLIIKEIKQGAENVFHNQTHKIRISDQLKDLLPDSYVQFMDWNDLSEDMDEFEEISSGTVSKATVNRDLWKDNQNNSVVDQSSSSEVIEMDSDAYVIGDIHTTMGSINDWFDEDSVEEDEESASSIFLREQGNPTMTNYPESLNDFNSMFDASQELEVDEWGKKETVFIEEEDKNWDVFNDSREESESNEKREELEVSHNNENASDEELFSLLDELTDEHDNDSAQEYDDIGTEVKVTIGDFDITKDELRIDNSREEIDDIFKQTLIIDDGDDEVPLSVQRAYQYREQSESSTMTYDEFEDLENFLENHQNEHLNRPFEQLDSFLQEFVIYYESFEDLDLLIESENFLAKFNSWLELDNLIAIDNSEQKTRKTKTTYITKEEEEIVEQELSALDQLLIEAQSTRKKPQWESRATQTSTPATQKPSFEKTMRVSVKQLDSLNNLVGEMVIRRNRLEEDQDRLRQFLDNLLNHVQSLGDVGTRMQDLYERSLLEGALLASREKNRATAQEQLNRAKITTITKNSGTNSNIRSSTGGGDSHLELDDLELDRFSGFHLLSQEVIELIVRVRESTSDIQFLVDETEQLGRNLRQVTTQIQEEINKSRMIAFAQTADRLPRAVRDISISYGKEIELKVEGRDVLIDKMILEHLWDPIQQLVKNSITHGIEVPAVRDALGKLPTGTINIRTFLQGPQTVISISDDGAGINPEKVKQKAIEKKLITKAQALNLTDQDVYELLFHPGFSTKDKADSHAGRGVGLDIVRSKLNEIRGTVTIDSNVGTGTTFTIRLPLTLSIGKALCCLNDNARIAFPLDGIEDKKDYNSKDIVINEKGQKCISWQNNLLPYRSLSSLLTFNRQVSRSIIYSGANEDEVITILILRGGNNLLAVQVDQVIGEEEIVIKQISGPLPKPKGIAGATVRSDGIVMPIADVIELIDIAQGNLKKEVAMNVFPSSMMNTSTLMEAPVNSQSLVLIVDDSITVREMLSISFNKSGYRVEQARDGQEAWQKLRSGLPCDLVFCDIEMPRMNGLELLKHIQEDETLSDIPVAILSSRGAEKHQKLAAELGASAYLIKPYVEKDLLDSAKRMLDGEVLLSGSTKQVKPQVKLRKTTQSGENNVPRRRTNNSAPMVLIIDDSVVVREMLSMTFKKVGYKVEQARDGQDAWDKISDGLPCDIILCDIEMPRMNGLELLARIQQDEELSQIPVAMVTSRGAEKHRKIAADLGAKAYFTKPYLEEELLEASTRLIEGEVLLTQV